VDAQAEADVEAVEAAAAAARATAAQLDALATGMRLRALQAERSS
jgi:hypothetical protein